MAETGGESAAAGETASGGAAAAAPARAVLVTGAAGRIGRSFARGHGAFHENPYRLRLMVRGDEEPEELADLEGLGELVTADLGDLDALKRACEGADTVVHLAANASASATWAELLPTNIVGTYHVFAAAKAAGVRRVLFASSIHAVSGYPADVQVKHDDPVNPGDLYGVSKVFGEALCRYMAGHEGVSAIAIRIAAFHGPEKRATPPRSLSVLDAFLSARDMNQLLVRAIEAPDALRFAVVHGVSDNRYKRLDITSARELLGYAPQDDYATLHPALSEIDFAGRVRAHNVSDPGMKSGLREDV